MHGGKSEQNYFHERTKKPVRFPPKKHFLILLAILQVEEVMEQVMVSIRRVLEVAIAW